MLSLENYATIDLRHLYADLFKQIIVNMSSIYVEQFWKLSCGLSIIFGFFRETQSLT